MSGVKSTAKLKFSVKFKSLYSLWSGIIFHVLIKIFGFMTLMEIGNHFYSLVPNERHVLKESNGSTLGLCVMPKESHDSTLIKELTPKESHDCSFSLT